MQRKPIKMLVPLDGPQSPAVPQAKNIDLGGLEGTEVDWRGPRGTAIFIGFLRVSDPKEQKIFFP